MANLDAKTYASQSASTTAGFPVAPKKLYKVESTYTYAGTEDVADVIRIVTLPANTTVVPQLSTIKTTENITIDLGHGGDADAYVNDFDCTTAINGLWTATGSLGAEATVPVLKTGSYNVQATVVASGSVGTTDVIFGVVYEAQ